MVDKRKKGSVEKRKGVRENKIGRKEENGEGRKK